MLSKTLNLTQNLLNTMTKDQLALEISREMHKDREGRWSSFNTYQCIRSYFADLSIEDMAGIASQYGIKV